MRPWTLVRRGFPFAIVTAVAAATLVAAPDTNRSVVVSAEPKPAEVKEIAVPAVDAARPQATAETRQAPRATEQPPRATDRRDAGKPRATQEAAEPAAELRKSTSTFALLGVTWDRGTDEVPTVQVRWRSLADGWSDWTRLEVPPTAAASTGTRPGTEPLWVGDSNAVDVRVSTPSGRAPRGVRVSTVTDGENGGAVVPTAASVGQPPIISRAAWGAKRGSTCSAPVYGASMLGTTLHHTAGSNSYTKAQSAGIVRATQAYHTGSQGWCDIGYNFLVDRYGQIFEGRKGGITKMVRGAHAGVNAANERTIGVSMMGNFDVARPPKALRTAVANLIAWRHSIAGVPATGTYSLGGKRVNRIMGHRDVMSTACPGRYGYAWLNASDGLRPAVARRLKGYKPPTSAASSTPKPTPRPTTPGSTKNISTLAQQIGSARLGKLLRAEYGDGNQRRAVYANMDLFWTKADGAFAVAGAVRDELSRTGGHGGTLGFPVSTLEKTSASGVSVQRFQKGYIYLAESGGKSYPRALYGPLLKEYRAQSGTGGPLGTPRSAVFQDRPGYSRATFANGYLEVAEASGVVSTWYTKGSSPDRLTVPSNRSVVISGHGFGHGIGMSQYGAQGAARQGRTFQQILATYYPGTALTKRSGSIRVLLSPTSSSTLTITARSGLRFRPTSTSKRTSLPTAISGSKVSQWRIKPLNSDPRKSVLQAKRGSRWGTYANTIWTGSAQFEASSLGLVVPGGKVLSYRGALRSAVPSAGAKNRKIVNILKLDTYLRGVVGSEMPSGWQPEALKAQAVAARTYAVRSLAPSRYYDVCDTTACQVYRGVAGEAASVTTAVQSTAGLILTYRGAPALTQYSSSSGGAVAAGSQPYLRGRLDPWDGWSGNPNHTWRTVVKASTIEARYPAIGTLKRLEVAKRDGNGDWRGRVVSIRLVGSKRTVTVAGTDLRFALGLKSHYFRLG